MLELVNSLLSTVKGLVVFSVGNSIGSVITLNLSVDCDSFSKKSGWSIIIYDAFWSLHDCVSTIISADNERQDISTSIRTLVGRKIESVKLIDMLNMRIIFSNGLSLSVLSNSPKADLTHSTKWDIFNGENYIITLDRGNFLKIVPQNYPLS